MTTPQMPARRRNEGPSEPNGSRRGVKNADSKEPKAADKKV